MSGVLIEEVEGLVDPLVEYQWLMNISPVRGQNIIGNDVLSLRCTSTGLPGSTIGQVDVPLGGYNLRYSGRRTFPNTWSTTLIEGQDLGIILQIASWMKLIYDQTTGVGVFKADYASIATIELFNNPNEVIGVRYIYGIWPQNDPGIARLSQAATNTPVTPTVNWSFDIWDDDALADQGVTF